MLYVVMAIIRKMGALVQDSTLFRLKKGFLTSFSIIINEGGQWLSGRVLDSRVKDRGFEPHRGHCIKSLSKTH